MGRGPRRPADYIFPFMNLAYFTVANIEQFQYLMYRPLYWFGSVGRRRSMPRFRWQRLPSTPGATRPWW